MHTFPAERPPALRLSPYVAMFWGGSVFFPIALNYIAMGLLLGCVLSEIVIDRVELKDRFDRLRAYPSWWPLVFYVVWTLIVLAVQPHYEQTPSNLFHAMRIALTLALALSLTKREAIFALKGFLGGAAIALIIVGLHYMGMPDTRAWTSLTHHAGNKSIAIAILFALIASCFLVVAIEKRGILSIASIPLAAVPVSIAVWTIPSRTSLIVMLMTLVAAGVHKWRRKWTAIFAIFVVAAVVAVAVFMSVPQVKARFTQGVTEVEQAQAGDVSENSWSVRFHMYTETTHMMLDKPFMGWGIGGWTDQWLLRTPPILHPFNMPHDDFLWMGSQAGIPGALSLLVLFLAVLVQPWKRKDLTGRLAFVAGLTLLLTTSVHSANRDAAIGLSLLWIVGVFLRLSREPGVAIAALRTDQAQTPTSHPGQTPQP